MIEQHIAAVLAQVEDLPLEQRWEVLEKALERSTKPPPKLVIRHDEDPTPARDGDHLGLMACWHRRYKLGDEQPKEDPDEWFKSLPTGTVTIPLYLYDHSGLTMSTTPFSCPWDSGRVGWIVATPDAIREAYGELSEKTTAQALETLRLEVKDYDCHLRGQVWGYEFGDDSCWGFVGDELEDTGLKDMIPPEALNQLEAAWEARS